MDWGYVFVRGAIVRDNIFVRGGGLIIIYFVQE
jgi:hypothetical protein